MYQFNQSFNSEIKINMNRNLVSTLIQRENGEKAFQEKIEKCVEKIKRNENEYRIDLIQEMCVV